MWAPRFIHVISELFVEDGMIEHADERDKARAAVMRKLLGYDSTEDSYGRSNDNLGGSQSQAPLPYLAPTEFSDDGYAGLDPPMG